MAAEVSGSGVRRAILGKGEGANIGLGGMFPPAPTYIGFIGKMYLVKGILTTTDEAYLDKDLCAWGGVDATK